MWETMLAIPEPVLISFLAGGILLNLTPGQDVLYATASGLQGGPRAGVLAGLGVGLGAIWHVALSAAGLSAVIAAHPAALVAIRYGGALYLLYIAWKSWRKPAEIHTKTKGFSGWRAFWRGALTNILNPKPILFMLAFLPQFVDVSRGPVWQQIVFLGTLFGLTGALITSGYGFLAGRLGHAVGQRLGALNKVAAILFAGMALRLIVTE